MEELMKLYAALVEQREELVNKMDEMDETERSGTTSRSLTNPQYTRLNRERIWREEQVIALLGGIIRKEFN